MGRPQESELEWLSEVEVCVRGGEGYRVNVLLVPAEGVPSQMEVVGAALMVVVEGPSVTDRPEVDGIHLAVCGVEVSRSADARHAGAAECTPAAHQTGTAVDAHSAGPSTARMHSEADREQAPLALMDGVAHSAACLVQLRHL